MWQFNSLLLFAVCSIVLPKAAEGGNVQLHDELHLNSTTYSENEHLSSFFDVGDDNSDLMMSIDEEEYEDEDDSDFTIVYDEKDGYRTIPLSEMQADEVIPAFDAARDVRFELYTPKNPVQPQLLTLGNYTTVKQSNFNWLHSTRILIHGW